MTKQVLTTYLLVQIPSGISSATCWLFLRLLMALCLRIWRSDSCQVSQQGASRVHTSGILLAICKLIAEEVAHVLMAIVYHVMSL